MLKLPFLRMYLNHNLPLFIHTFLLFFMLVYVTHVKTNSEFESVQCNGPGLSPDKIVMPARYFFIYLNGFNFTGEDETESRDLQVRIHGSTKNGRDCRLWFELLNRKDSSYIVRYKLYETCYNFVINVVYKSKQVNGFPLQFNGPIQSEDCYCPNAYFEKWLENYGCPPSHRQIKRDLSRYNKINMGNFHEKVVKRFNNSYSSSVCHYVVKSNKVYRTCYGQHIGFKMFIDAILVSLSRKVVLPDLEMFTNLGDWPLMRLEDVDPLPIFSWCGSQDTSDIVMPTYDITESSLEAMGRVTLDMLSVQGHIERKWADKEPKVFWRGRDSSRQRLNLIDIARAHSHLFNASLTNFFFFREEQDKYGPKAELVSFFKFFDFKYQLCLDGTVAAYRYPYLLAGDSLVLKPTSPYHEHFYKELQPWVHYVPVKYDLSDLIEKVNWALANDQKAQAIATNGQNFARNNLLPQNIFCYHASLFNEWSKKLDNEIKIREGMELVSESSNKNSDKTGCVCDDSRRNDEL